eukprot:8603135-Lingulodinium_polyedra.AAC.1
MVRSHRPCAATTARDSHASHTPCKHQKWRSHGAREACDLRAAAAADSRCDCIIAHGFKNRAQ